MSLERVSLNRKMSTLVEIEEAIAEVRQRRQALIHLYHLLYQLTEESVIGESEYPEYPVLPLPLDDLSTCSRRTRTESPFPFTPTISDRSRKLAAKRQRPPVYQPIPATPKTTKIPEVKTPQMSAITEAIVTRIKQSYGSLDAYHRQRREVALSYKDFPNKQEAELRECTFQPHIEPTKIPVGPPKKKISGLEEYVKRQEKARSRKAVQVEEKRPGSGAVYTGKPTKVEPFALGKRPVEERTSIRE